MAQSGNNKRPKLPSWMTSAPAEKGAPASAKDEPRADEAKQPPAAGGRTAGSEAAAAAGDNGSAADNKTVKDNPKTAVEAVSDDKETQTDTAEPAAAAAAETAQKTATDESCRNSVPAETAQAAAPAESASAAVPEDGFVLLGAPSLAEDDGAADDLLAPTEITEENVPEAHPLACIVGGFAAPLQLPGDASAAPASQHAEKEHSDSVHSVASAAVSLKHTETHETKKMQSELEQLSSIVDAVDSLEYMKPRLRKLELAGYQASDLVNLYRLASQVLLENWQNQIQRTNKLRDRYEKRLREVVIDKSSEFVQMVTSGQVPLDSDDDAGSSHEAGSFMLRKQLEIKEELLMKTRESLAEAEARYDKVARDVVNIRQRQAKDVALHLQKARESLFTKLLPVLDSFDSALAASDSFVDVASVVEGLSNIHKQLLDACMSEGLEPIEAEGKLFNPNLHQAMGSVPTDEVPEDYVVTDLRRGYMLNEKLLRATMVQVAVACQE